MDTLDKIIDQHMHSYFSPDSGEKFENYLALTKGPVISTEHLDFYDVNYRGQDTILDYQAYTDTIDGLNEIYQGRLKKGIEAGFTPSTESQIINYLDSKDFDLVILSLHQNHKRDYMASIARDEDLLEFARGYYQDLLLGVSSSINYNVLGHMDYCLRHESYDLELLKKLTYLFKPILKELIERQASLELNTRSMYQFGGLNFYKYILDLYQELGGSLVSLGSDAHYTNNYKFNFPEALRLLKSRGLDKISIYDKQELSFIKI